MRQTHEVIYLQYAAADRKIRISYPKCTFLCSNCFRAHSRKNCKNIGTNVFMYCFSFPFWSTPGRSGESRIEAALSLQRSDVYFELAQVSTSAQWNRDLELLFDKILQMKQGKVKAQYFEQLWSAGGTIQSELRFLPLTLSTNFEPCELWARLWALKWFAIDLARA